MSVSCESCKKIKPHLTGVVELRTASFCCGVETFLQLKQPSCQSPRRLNSRGGGVNHKEESNRQSLMSQCLLFRDRRWRYDRVIQSEPRDR